LLLGDKEMRLLAKACTWIKSIAFVMSNPELRKFFRNVGVCISGKLYPNGVIKNIGGIDTFRMSPEFTFYNLDEWGSGKNNGFSKLVELAKGKSVVFDIGAHIGICALPISRVMKKGGVCYSFEPARANRRYLETHLKMNNVDNVIIVSCLVGDKCDDSVEFFESSTDSGINSICQLKNKDSIYNKIVKEQVTLDSFVAKYCCIPGLIKIDVEGAEINVLRGAKSVLREYHPEIIISVHPNHLEIQGYSVDELTKEIRGLGYQIYNIDGSQLNDKLQSGEYSWNNYNALNYPWISKRRKKFLQYLYFATLMLNPEYEYINSLTWRYVCRLLYPFMRLRVKTLYFGYSPILYLLYLLKKLNLT
jgi:FkbM family methyltransferase